MLISVVCLYLILVCPSTVLSLLVDYIISQSHATLKGYQIAVVLTNMAQAIFFSMNFGLYCSISKPFRDSVSTQILCKRSSGRMTTESKNRYKAVAFHKSWKSNSFVDSEFLQIKAVQDAWTPRPWKHQGLYPVSRIWLRRDGVCTSKVQNLQNWIKFCFVSQVKLLFFLQGFSFLLVRLHFPPHFHFGKFQKKSKVVVYHEIIVS